MSKKDIKEQQEAIKELKKVIKKEIIIPIEKIFIKYIILVLIIVCWEIANF